MIQLNRDCLIFRTSDGDNVPCPAELVTLELIGDAAEFLDPQLVENASAAVLHHFKVDQGKTFVTVAEFAEALEKVLRGFGLSVAPAQEELSEPKVEEADLRLIASTSGKGCELFFFPHLRDEMRRKLSQSPQVVRFCGLRPCVKQIVGARRWSPRCQKLNDQIVEFLRGCLTQDKAGNQCALVVC